MKTKIFIAIGIIILVLATSYFVFFKGKSTIKQADIDFKIADSSEIYQVLIVENEDSIFLEKKAGYWSLNNRYSADNKRVKNLLIGTTLLEMKSPVPKNAKKVFAEKLKNRKNVKIFGNKGQILKEYFLGDAIADKSANYMMLSGADEPFLVFIPAVATDLNNYFEIDEKKWRDKTIFRYTPLEIREVEFFDFVNDENSFVLTKKENNSFVLKKTASSNEEKQANAEQANYYFSKFGRIEFVNFVKNSDILNENSKLFSLKVTDKEGVSNKIEAYKKIVSGKPDTDFFLAEINDGETVEAKYYNFDLIIKNYSYFE